jgi:hypothetical protein
MKRKSKKKKGKKTTSTTEKTMEENTAYSRMELEEDF